MKVPNEGADLCTRPLFDRAPEEPEAWDERVMADDPDLDELADEADPYNCVACLEAGDSCDFHVGFGKGWDACAAFIAEHIDEAGVMA